MIQKQEIPVNFSQGLDLKTDPWQVSLGKFLSLENSIFTKGGLLQKRNGYAQIADLPNSSYLTTLNGNLTAVGNSITALNEGTGLPVSRGTIAPMAANTLPLIRNSINQIQCDAVIAPNGSICTVYTEQNNGTSVYKYAIADSVTGQNIIAPTLIPVASGVVTGSPRVFLLGNFFVIVFTNVITNVISSVSHLQYITISSLNPGSHTTNQDMAPSYVPASTVSWDGVVCEGNLYIAYNTLSGGQSVKVTFLSTNAASLGQTPATPATFASSIATMISLCADITNSTNPIIYINFYDSASSTGYTGAVNTALTVLFIQETILSGTYLNLASAAQNGVCTVFGEVANTYSYNSLPSHFINGFMVTSAGTVGSIYQVIRSVGLASKAFILNGVIYFLAAYQSTYQPSYFLINGSTSVQAMPIIVGKLAYENGGGYLTLGLPSVSVSDITAYLPYLYKDFIAAENTVIATPVANPILGVYSQTGINLGSFSFGIGIDTVEISGNLNISGGFLWQYDGFYPVENNFFVFPDDIGVTTATTGGNIGAGTYFYAAVYEWEDNQGNVYRSAPSIEPTIVTTGSTSANTVNVPYLRLTYKIPNPAKIVIYRWSQAQPIFYRVTSLTSVQLNSTSNTNDFLAYIDLLADSAIVGNDILYTTGGVVEDVNAPASNILTLFDTRLWLVDAEDQNLLWFSKQVIEATPVEMSDLFTFYIAPTTAAQGSTGPITALAPLDDKLIIFKGNAIYYINGTGPDNTGANNNYSQPIFITSTVGCTNQQSIVFMPQGLMFQSDKGIWLLGRDLSTQYIGAPVEDFNSSIVQSAVNIPETNQVRFTLNTGQTLMYDYYYAQWGTFVNVPSISSCLYQNLHTFINSSGLVFQETPGFYLDGSNPVLMAFTTSWLNLAGVQGYQRAFFFYLLGKYYSPHKLYLQIAYDYNDSALHSVLIEPTNYSPAYGGNGSDSADLYGQQLKYGGPAAVENWRVFFKKQRCQSFQIQFNEIYDPSFGVSAGAGLTLSGLNLVVGLKAGWKTIGSAHSAGVS